MQSGPIQGPFLSIWGYLGALGPTVAAILDIRGH